MGTKNGVARSRTAVFVGFHSINSFKTEKDRSHVDFYFRLQLFRLFIPGYSLVAQPPKSSEKSRGSPVGQGTRVVNS